MYMEALCMSVHVEVLDVKAMFELGKSILTENFIKNSKQRRFE